jgi:hypothetical protein
MQFSGLKNIFKIQLQLQLEVCWGGIIMSPSWQLELNMKAKNIPLRCGGLVIDSHLPLVL